MSALVGYLLTSTANISQALAEEREANALDDIQQLVGEHGEMQSLISECSIGIRDPSSLIARVKSTFGIDRDIDAEIMAATGEYNIAVCCTVAENCLEKLPHELRDMVYQHLIPPIVEIMADPRYPPASLWYLNSGKPYVPSTPRSAGDALCSEHYWRDDAVGTEMASELVERFYKTTVFYVLTNDLQEDFRPSKSPGLASMIKQDRFRMGFEPQQLIRHFTREWHVRSERLMAQAALMVREKGVTDDLEQLLLLSEGCAVSIMVYLDMESIWDPDEDAISFGNFLDMIHPGALNLIQSGHEVDVQLANRGNEMKEDVSAWLSRLEREAEGSSRSGMPQARERR